MTQAIEILRFFDYNPNFSRAEIGYALTTATSLEILKQLLVASFRPCYSAFFYTLSD